jgi:NAD(P)-dependent dehydrogenase (short-subunit alcohol dehydrogenase family)
VRAVVLLTYAENNIAADDVVKRIRSAGGQSQAVTGPPSALVEAKTEVLARVLEVDLLGAMICAREAVRRMSTRSGDAASYVHGANLPVAGGR